jgi:aldehyde:ferredoxin oxidoreductase
MRNIVLYINLSSKEISRRELDENLSEQYIGGAGVGWVLIAEHLPPNVDAFSPENVIVISVGALVGTNAPGASKVGAIFKCPIIATEDGKQFIGESTGGGRYFAPMLKMAGYDHLVIFGKSDEPVYIFINDDQVSIMNADDLWGKSTEETADDLINEFGIDTGVLTIGPAGENLIRYSMAFIDKTNSLGRSGLGAVMGSKNLKAVAVRGTKGVAVPDPVGFSKAVEKMSDPILAWPGREHWIGLGMGAGWSKFIHTQYVGKWTKKRWDELYGEPKRLETLDRVIACRSCLLSCRVKWRIPDGEYAGETGLGSPYGKSATSGQLLDIEDHRKTIHLVNLANNEGIDFYTTTRMMDFVTGLYEQRVLTDKDTGGQRLGRTYEDYLSLFDQIVHRQGFGNILAEGWLGLSHELGINPQDYWYGGICKGVDFIYDGRSSNLHPMMMSFFTRPRPHHGGSHTLTNSPNNSLEVIREQMETLGLSKDTLNRIFTATPHSGELNVGRYTKYLEDWMRVKNSLGLCSVYTFIGLVSGEMMAEVYSQAVGKTVSSGELMKHGERISNLSKYLNSLEGFNRQHDKVPNLWLRPMDTPEGRIEMQDYFKTMVMNEDMVEKILDDYYDERGWDIKDGNPGPEKLKELNITELPRPLGAEKEGKS